MAVNKSSEENILYQCLECKRHRVIKNGIDGSRCNYCDGHLTPISPTNLPTSKEGKKTIHYGDITITADVSDALKGLKAVQREARKATATLKELEATQNRITPRTVFEGETECPKCKSNDMLIEQKLAGGYGVVEEKKLCKDCGWSND